MESFKKPNVRAPRFRPKRYNILNAELFKQFKLKFPQYANLTYAEFKKIISTCHDILQEHIVEERNGIELEESLGYMFVGTCPKATTGRQAIDFGKSIKYGVKTYHKNWETDGHGCKIFYTNFSVKYKIQNRELWRFKSCRKFSLLVKEEYPKDWTKYVVVERTAVISQLFIKEKKKQYLINSGESSMSSYNEFDI